MTPQQLHDAWLVITVITTLCLAGIAVYLWKMFRNSSRRWFFWSLAFVLASIAAEHVSAEIKNLGQPPPADFHIALIWVIGRTQEMIVAAFALGYMVFGSNGKTAPAAPEDKTGS